MASSINDQLYMLAAALAAGLLIGIGFDLRWFFCRALKLPLRFVWDMLYLLSAAFLLFTLFQHCGGSVRPDLLFFALGAAALYEALLGAQIRCILGRLAIFLCIPFKYVKKELKKVIVFMKKSLANAKKRFMIKKATSCLRSGFFTKAGRGAIICD